VGQSVPRRSGLERFRAVWREDGRERAVKSQTRVASGFRLNGAAPESNRPSRGLHDRTGFEDQSRVAQPGRSPGVWDTLRDSRLEQPPPL
jgi:hypothetical protein